MKLKNKKMRKDLLQKKRKANTRDKLNNQDNCFLASLQAISTKFWDSPFLTKFKSLGYNNQIGAANKHLSQYNQELIKVFSGKRILKDYVKSIKIKSLVVFWKSLGKMHVEAVENGIFLNELQSFTTENLENEVNIETFELSIKID